MSKPSVPKGTRDFIPEQALKRSYIFDTLKGIFQRFGYMPIETPAMENLGTLMGKYGEEGDRLIFKILNSGDYLSKANEEALENKNSVKLTSSISKKALRFDLTVPFARFVVQHQNEINFPFKRYQIQPVWRGDRPAKGRYQEFYQCDVDVVGSNSLLNEIELLQIANSGFAKLGLPDVTIKLNNRKVLTGMAEVLGEAERITDITVAIDKLDKKPLEEVNAEMLEKGISQDAVDRLQPLMNLEGSTADRIAFLRDFLADSEIGQKGLDELQFIFDSIAPLGIDNVEFELTLARGLNYYTGAIFEVTHPEFNSSICGGGRYDDLTGIFGMKNLSGVGISFGADRIYDLLLAKDLFPHNLSTSTQVMFVNFGQAEAAHCLQLLGKLRDAGVNAELYPDKAKMGKQMNYANDRNIGKVVLVGSQEIESGQLSVKDMESGEQSKMTIEELVASFQA